MTELPGSEPTLEAYVPDPVRRRRTGRAWAAAVAGVGAAVAGVVAVVSLSSAGGSGTPEAAVRKLVSAVASEDVLGALEALAPAERTGLADRLRDFAGELGRLGVLAGGLDLGRVAGADVQVDGLTLRTEPLAGGVAVVVVTGGTGRVVIDPAVPALGPAAHRLLGTGPVRSPAPLDLGSRGLRLATVRRDGGWFVSLAYTAAEALRRDAGAAVPSFGRGVTPRGEPSPEALVRELARAGAALDVRRLLELTAPGEADALHDYAPLFLPDVERAVADAKARGVRPEVTALELHAERTGSSARVTVDRLDVGVATAAGAWTFGYDGRCIRLTSPSPGGWFAYAPDTGGPAPASRPGEVCRTGDGPARSLRSAFDFFTLTVVERGGAWYLSPAGSYLDVVIASLRATTRQELEEGPAELGAYLLWTRLVPSPFGVIEPLLFGDGGADGGYTCPDAGGPCGEPSVAPLEPGPAPPASAPGVRPPGPSPTLAVETSLP